MKVAKTRCGLDSRIYGIWKDNSEIGIASGTYLKGDEVVFRDGRNLVAKSNIPTPHYVI
jgi:signal peptidase I